MKLIIGGYAQGKLQYVLRKDPVETEKIWDGQLPESGDVAEGKIILQGSAEELRNSTGKSIDQLYIQTFKDF